MVSIWCPGHKNFDTSPLRKAPPDAPRAWHLIGPPQPPLGYAIAAKNQTGAFGQKGVVFPTKMAAKAKKLTREKDHLFQEGNTEDNDFSGVA